MATDPARVRRILRQHVQTDQLLGVDAVPLGVRQVLATTAEPVSLSATPPAMPAAPIGASPLSKPVMAAAEALGRPIYQDRPLRGAKAKMLEELDEQHVRGCTRCVLCQSRTHTVFGCGNPDARLMFIGEGPGQTEDEQGLPFVGRAGELLTKMILAMGLTREQVYIANVVKCRPPNNRPPQPPEVAACTPYLFAQIAAIQPEVIVSLGGPATKLVAATEEGITRIRGTWHVFRGLESQGGPAIPVMPTFHPAYVLRSYTVDNRKKVWSDLQQVMLRLQAGD